MEVPFDIFTYIAIAFLVILFLYSAIKVLREYERAVVFTLGRFTGVRGPGLILLIPYVQQMVRVDMRVVVLDVPSQDVISRDNVSVKVSAVVYARVIEADRATIQVENYLQATGELAQTTLRSVLGKHELDEMLSERKVGWDESGGRVRAQGEIWRARSDKPLQAGQSVRIKGLQGLVLEVEPESRKKE